MFAGLSTSFGRPRPVEQIDDAPPAGQAPAPLTRKSDAKKLAFIRDADEVIACLPGPGEQLHALMTGRYDLTDLIGRTLANIGQPVEMLIATLSYNGRNLGHMTDWLDTGQVTTLGLVCSKFFREHNKELYEETREEFQARGARLACPRSHAKVVTLHAPSAGLKMVFEGSANLRTNSNQEQIAILNCEKLHDWHAQWIDRLLSEA